MHQCVLPNKMKNLHLAFVLRVIDNKQVHGVICKQTEQHVVSLHIVSSYCNTACDPLYV